MLSVAGYGPALGQQVDGPSRHHQPAGATDSHQATLQGSQSIAKQTANRRGWHHTPTGLLTDQHHGGLAADQARLQLITELQPGGGL